MKIALFISGFGAWAVAVLVGVFLPSSWLVVPVFYGVGALLLLALLLKNKGFALGALLLGAGAGVMIYRDLRMFLMATIIILILLSRKEAIPM